MELSIKLLPYSPQSNEKSNVERNDGFIIYKFGTILTAKGNTKKFCFFKKKVILFVHNTIFYNQFIMLCYYKREDLTEKVTIDGWLVPYKGYW